MPENATADNSPPVSTREKVLRAARELFAERGFKGTTTAAISQRAGVNEALIFRHFPTKRDLYVAILSNRIEGEGLVRLVKAAECPDLPVEESLRLVALRFLESSDPTFLRLYFHSALEGQEIATRFHEQYMERFMDAIEQLLERGIGEGIFRPMDTVLVARAFIGMFRSLVINEALFPLQTAKRADSEVVDSLCGVFFGGVRAV